MSNNNNSSRRIARLALAASAAALLAACSSDIERLGDYPPVENTQSVAAASGKVESAPLAQPGASSTPWRNPTPSWAREPSRAVQPSASSYAAPVRQPVADNATGSIVVRPGQTLYSIARANGKTVAELMAANGLSSPQLKVGQHLVIPGVANPVSPAPAMASTGAAPVAMPTRAPASDGNVRATRAHRVQPGETIYALGRKYGVHPKRIAAANGLAPNALLKVGQMVRIPASDGWNMAAAPQVERKPRPPRARDEGAATPVKDEERIADAPRSPDSDGGNTTARVNSSGFVWPVRGRVLTRFGASKDGMRSEGINIAAPEGAPVRAAAEGVVAYAGNELKGYGNLVLIRHPGGWVTAYAHNSELMVKRGERVKRGQVIAKVGKTGSVKSAQLHFELRKGATPVDPMKYLGTMTAMR